MNSQQSSPLRKKLFRLVTIRISAVRRGDSFVRGGGMAKDAYYFPHDSNARHDPKMCSLIHRHGMAGYGWYWVIIEMLREQDGYQLGRDEDTVDAIAMQCQTTTEIMQAFLSDAIRLKLFSADDGAFWSESLKRRMIPFEERSKQARNAIEARWRYASNTDVSPENNGSNTSKVDKSRVDKNRVDETAKPAAVDPMDEWAIAGRMFIQAFPAQRQYGNWQKVGETLKADWSETHTAEQIQAAIKRAEKLGIKTASPRTLFNAIAEAEKPKDAEEDFERMFAETREELRRQGAIQ